MKGHGILNEGAAFIVPNCDHARCGVYREARRFAWQGVSGSGHGLCACGAISPHLESGNQRKAWHREHKQAST